MMLTVREAVERDLPDIIAIENQSFPDPWSEAAFYRSLHNENERVYVADESGWIVGFTVVLLNAPDSEIQTIAVDLASRRRGIAGEMLDWVVAQVNIMGCDAVYLEVRASNTAARRLYESRSFKQVGMRRGYYAFPPEDAVIMKRKI